MNNQETEEINIQANVSGTAAPSGSLLSLLGKYGEKEDAVEKGVFYAKLPKGDRMKCRIVTDADEVESLGRRAQKWAQSQAVKPQEAWMETWRPYYTDNVVLIAKVWVFSQLCLEPDFKNNHLNCLIAARKVGPVFNGVLEQINMASSNLLIEESEDFEEAGND
jgi:hypothetical protein